MATISSSDNLFASASIMGEQIFNFVGTGVGGGGGGGGIVRSWPMARPGMVTLTVRNSSQGWSQSRAFYLGA